MPAARGSLGSTVHLGLTIREDTTDNSDGALFDVDGVHVEKIERPDGTDVSGLPVPERQGVGDWVVTWNTSGETQVGDYTVHLAMRTGTDPSTGDAIVRKRTPVVRLGDRSVAG